MDDPTLTGVYATMSKEQLDLCNKPMLGFLAHDAIMGEDVRESWHKCIHGREYLDVARTIRDIHYGYHFCQDLAVVRKAEYYLERAKNVHAIADEFWKKYDPEQYRRWQIAKEREKKDKERLQEFANVLGAVIE